MAGVAGSNREPLPPSDLPGAGVNRRRSERLLLTVPIRVERIEAGSKGFAETTRTLVINRHGARIQLKHPVAPGIVLRITNLAGNHSAQFRVVGPTSPLSEQGGEWGVECLDEKVNLWGIGFPPPLAESTQGSALLECRQCHTVNLTPLSVVEQDVLTTAGLIGRECKGCGGTTSWGVAEQSIAFPEPGQAMDPSIQEALEPPRPSENRRVHPRVALQLPIRVRSYFGVVEFVKSENVSRGGLGFVSEKDYQMGEIVLVTCPYEKGGSNIETRAKVVRRREMKGTPRRVYGVRYER